MSAKDYRPWERPRLIGRCASCGQRCTLTEHGLCDTCTGSTRETPTWAPAFPSPASRSRTVPDGHSCQAASLPTIERPIESAGAASFSCQSRDTW